METQVRNRFFQLQIKFLNMYVSQGGVSYSGAKSDTFYFQNGISFKIVVEFC